MPSGRTETARTMAFHIASWYLVSQLVQAKKEAHRSAPSSNLMGSISGGRSGRPGVACSGLGRSLVAQDEGAPHRLDHEDRHQRRRRVEGQPDDETRPASI